MKSKRPSGRPPTLWPPATTSGLAAGLILAVFFVYFRVQAYPFIHFDDSDYVYDNPRVPLGLSWSNVLWAFQTNFACNWHPLTWLSHMLDCQLFGLNPGAFHLVNVGLHACNAVLVFWLLNEWTGSRWASAFAAGIFGLHPVHVESVAWIAERKDVLAAFWGLWCLHFYTSYVRSDQLSAQRKNFALCFFSLLLGLLSKPMLVTWPFLFLVLDRWPFERLSTNRLSKSLPFILEKWPFFLLALGSSAATFWAQKTGGSVMSLESFPLQARVFNSCWSYLRYLGLYFWPADLIIPYGVAPQLPTTMGFACLFFLAGLTVAVFFLPTRLGFLGTGWLWFLGTLVPVIGLLQVGTQSIACRYLYLPSIGLLLILTVSLHGLWSRLKLPALIVGVLGAAALLGLSARTSAQLSLWENGEKLFKHTLDIDRDNYQAVCILAWIYASDPDPKLRNGPRAVELSEMLVEATKRQEPFILNTLAAAYAETGDYPRALKTAEEALSLPGVKEWGMFVQLSESQMAKYRQNRALRP